MFGRVTRTVAWLIVASAVTSAQEPPVPDEVIVWSAARKLDWKDFKGKPPAGTLGGALSAISRRSRQSRRLARSSNGTAARRSCRARSIASGAQALGSVPRDAAMRW